LIRTALALLVLASTPVRAQHFFEVRLADPEYLYFDWNYTFPGSGVVDLFYVGVPGSDEFNLGGGYAFKPSPSFTVAPLAYAVLAEQGSQRGVKLALLASFEKDAWRATGFLAYFIRTSGEVASYQVLDSLDGVRKVGDHLELGLSGGFFHANHEWNPLIGPLVRWADRHGYWSVSYRFGEENEVRAARVVTLD
jgi:hypothetical protein